MRTLVFAVLLIPLLAAPAAAQPQDPRHSDEALQFLVEVGREPGHVVHVILDESGGTGAGYDIALLDADGDGLFEEAQAFGQGEDFRGRTFRDVKISFERDDASWELDLNSFRYSRPAMREGVLTTYVRWSVTKEGFYAWFINGRVTFAADVAKASTVRMGPPFHFETSAATRGAAALARVGLKDSNGCTLRLARGEGNQQLRPEVKLSAGGEEKFKAYASYG